MKPIKLILALVSKVDVMDILQWYSVYQKYCKKFQLTKSERNQLFTALIDIVKTPNNENLIDTLKVVLPNSVVETQLDKIEAKLEKEGNKQYASGVAIVLAVVATLKEAVKDLK